MVAGNQTIAMDWRKTYNDQHPKILIRISAHAR
jgi:hypothetical protein